MSFPVQFPGGISVAAAQELIVAACRTRRMDDEGVAVVDALGRVLAEDMRAPFDVPGFANSAMDGYALRQADLPRSGERIFKLAGVMLAGTPNEAALGDGECVRITTGAPLPRGADTVVIKEVARVTAEGVALPAGSTLGSHVRPAGEDCRAGVLAIARGTPLAAAHLGVLASFGIGVVGVARRPRAAVLTTGDELVPQGRPLGYAQIHDSNGPLLCALLAQAGAEVAVRQHVRDEPAALRAALLEAAQACDIVLTSGGVSAGEADYLPGLLVELGRVLLWKVRVKPGMPFLAGALGSAQIFALPGNPVSGYATFHTLVRPGIDAMLGRVPRTQAPLRARLSHAVTKRHARMELLRASVSCNAEGVLEVAASSRQGSAVLSGVADSNALIVVPEEISELAAGAIVAVYPLADWD